MEMLEHNFEHLVRFCILLIELAGIAVIVISMIRGFIGFIRKDEHTRISLAQGIMLGLEFKIGSEVLRSVIVTTWNELGTLAAIILLRSLHAQRQAVHTARKRHIQPFARERPGIGLGGKLRIWQDIKRMVQLVQHPSHHIRRHQ